MNGRAILEKQRLAYRDKTGLCPICKNKPAVNGITCKNQSCIDLWVHNKTDPCAGLVDYGIQNYDCDIIAHVCYQTGELWTYHVNDGLLAINSGQYPKRPAYQYVDGEKVKTAGGYLVPPNRIPAYSILIPQGILNSYKIHNGMDTSTKGQRAQQIVSMCLARGAFPTQVIQSDEILDRDAQLRGNDIVVSSSIGTIQVKCDLPGGSKSRGGTGNLFLQVCEINPNKKY